MWVAQGAGGVRWLCVVWMAQGAGGVMWVAQGAGGYDRLGLGPR